MTENENFEGRNDISTKCPRVDLKYREISLGQNNNESKSMKVEMTKKPESPKIMLRGA